MLIIRALQHHARIIVWAKIDGRIYWTIRRACPKGRNGYPCHGRNGYRECGPF